MPMIRGRQIPIMVFWVLSDAQLLASYVEGDGSAFEELFRRYHRRLYRVACTLSVNAQDAEDALQEAMISACRSASRFRNDASVLTWLTRILINACTERMRKTLKAQTADITDITDADLDMGDRSGEQDTAVIINRALQRLPVGQRAAIFLVDMHGYSVSQAAAMLGVAEGTIKSRCARGRLSLAAALGYLSPAREV